MSKEMENSMEKQRRLDRFLTETVSIGRMSLQVVDLLFILCLCILGLLIRMELYPIESADYYGFLEAWMEEIRSAGGFRSLDHQISNYTSPYMYLMCLVSYLTPNSLYGLKTVSVVFDYVLAFTMFTLLYELTGRVRRSILGMAAVLLCPTVVMNSAYWCQCDVIYTAFLMLALLCFFKGESRRCMVFVGIAFSFKLQALFLVPFLIMMWLSRRTVRLRHVLYIPVMYLLMAIPAWCMGRDLRELVMIYAEQSGTYPWGTLEYPNIYALIGEVMPDMYHAKEVSGAGIFMTIMLLGVLAYVIYVKGVRITDRMAVTLALASVAVITYTLPHMHERYGFLVDILAILYGMLDHKKLLHTCGFILVSLLSYIPYLIGIHVVPVVYVAIGYLFLILLVLKDLYGQITVRESNPSEA